MCMIVSLVQMGKNYIRVVTLRRGASVFCGAFVYSKCPTTKYFQITISI